jgi:hypothetical protein
VSQNHFTLAFPLRANADAKALTEQLEPLLANLFQALDIIGRVYSSRFTILDERTLLFLADFDGEFGTLMTALAEGAGPVFDAIFLHVEKPPPTPVAGNVEAFVEWASQHVLRAATLFSAYPDVTVQDIKAMARAAGVTGEAQQLPFLVILPIKSSVAYVEVELLLHARSRKTQQDLATIGTPHFAQFVPLGNKRIGFFTVYDGSFEKYIDDFTKYIGPVFDLIFKFTRSPPPSPCRKYVQEFVAFAAGANRAPIGFYQANPGLTVQDIHALIADSKAASAGSA